MQPTTTHRAVLQFNSNTEEVIRISIPRARHDINEAEARSIMEAMITGGVIAGTKGRPVSIKRMDIVTTQRALLV
jgi:hypothetical protein